MFVLRSRASRTCHSNVCAHTRARHRVIALCRTAYIRRCQKNQAPNKEITSDSSDSKTHNLAETERAVQEAVARIESKLPTTIPKPTPTFASMTLSDEERDVIRKFFGVRKKEDATKFDAKVGAIAPDTAALYPIPSLLYSDVPKLKGYRQEQRSTKRGQSRFACVRR
jgi:hypothetical protein